VDEDFPAIKNWFPNQHLLVSGPPTSPPHFQSFGQALLGISTLGAHPPPSSPTDHPPATVVHTAPPPQNLGNQGDQALSSAVAPAIDRVADIRPVSARKPSSVEEAIVHRTNLQGS